MKAGRDEMLSLSSQPHSLKIFYSPEKGGDPSTASATDALLRLHPYHRSHRCPRYKTGPSGVTNSLGVTGGEYKIRERIHRGVLIPDY